MIESKVKYEGKPVQIIGSSRDLEDVHCPDCGQELIRELIKHDARTMYTIITCPNYRDKAWEDIFEKKDIGCSQDYANADKRFPI